MITRRVRIQLTIFALITLVGVSFVGARYAKLDRVVIDRSYTVVAHYPQSGGIFSGAEVTYRGVGIGQVGELRLTDKGVDVELEIEDKWDKIPADTLALVGNRSAVGEQYVELQPQTDDGPYLREGSEIDDVATPIATEKLLGNLASTVGSVDRQALTTTVAELGRAFGGVGEDLQRIIDTGNSFIETADENFDITSALIRDGNTVLKGQVASESSLRTFASQLSLFSRSLADADPALRKVIDNGSDAANQLRTFLEQSGVDLSELIANLVATGEVVVTKIPGIKQLLVAYPWAVLGGMTVVGKTPRSKGGSGFWDAHFGLILTTQPVCRSGYLTSRRDPSGDRGDAPMPTQVRCKEPATKSNPRGLQNLRLPRVAPDLTGLSPIVAGYDASTGAVTWGEPDGAAQGPRGNVAPPSLGKDSWKWLYLQPMLDR